MRDANFSRRMATIFRDANGPEHVEPDEMSRLLNGETPDEESAKAMVHITSCPFCLEMLSGIASANEAYRPQEIASPDDLISQTGQEPSNGSIFDPIIGITSSILGGFAAFKESITGPGPMPALGAEDHETPDHHSADVGELDDHHHGP